VINSRIRLHFHIFFLNPVYVAARALRSLRSNQNVAVEQGDASTGIVEVATASAGVKRIQGRKKN